MESGISGTKFRTVVVLILTIAVSALFLAVIWPFFNTLLLGALLAGLCHPLYRWLVQIFGGRKSLAATASLLILFILVAAPLSAFLGVVVRQAIAITDQAIPWVQQHLGSASAFNAHDWLAQKFPALANHIPSQEQLAAVGLRDLEGDPAESGIADHDGLLEQIGYRDWTQSVMAKASTKGPGGIESRAFAPSVVGSRCELLGTKPRRSLGRHCAQRSRVECSD